MVLQKSFEFCDAIGNAWNELVHASKVFIFVCVQQILEFIMEMIQVFFNQDLIASLD